MEAQEFVTELRVQFSLRPGWKGPGCQVGRSWLQERKFYAPWSMDG